MIETTQEAIWQDIEVLASDQRYSEYDEYWRDVIGYEGLYQISNLGRVRSVKRQIIRKPHQIGDYLYVIIYKKEKRSTKTVHKLVAEAFLGPCPKGKQVRHGSKDKTDNSVFNLSYGTPRQNALDRRRDGTHGGRAVRRSDGKEFISITVAAEEMGCSIYYIRKACENQQLVCGYTWRYIGPPQKPLKPRKVKRSDGKEFNSLGEAARFTNCSAASIWQVCKRNHRTAGGYGWEYIDA